MVEAVSGRLKIIQQHNALKPKQPGEWGSVEYPGQIGGVKSSVHKCARRTKSGGDDLPCGGAAEGELRVFPKLAQHRIKRCVVSGSIAALEGDCKAGVIGLKEREVAFGAADIAREDQSLRI